MDDLSVKPVDDGGVVSHARDEVGGAAVNPAVRMELEQPLAGAVVQASESLLGFGWVLAPSRVIALTVELDGVRICKAVTGLARTDVAELHGGHPGSGRAGFTFLGRLPPHALGRCFLQLTVQTEAGSHIQRVPIEVVGAAVAPTDELQALPAPALAEFGPIRMELEEARLDPGGALHVRGWALSAVAMQSVEVFLGDRSLGFADTSLSREDVAGAYPESAHAQAAGFTLNATPAAEWIAATELVTVVVIDIAGDTRASRIAVTGGARLVDVAARPAAMLAPMQVMLEEARINELGVLRVRGWGVSLSPIEHVRVFVGDRLLGSAAQNLPRDDVGVAHPDYPGSANAGFLLQLEVADDGLAGQLARVTVTAFGGIRRDVTAPIAVAPVVRRRERAAGAIQFHCDAIALAEDGALYIKGWAVCPSGVLGIDVEIGDEAVGQAEPGEERPDVGNHFPQIASARTAGFRFLGRVGGRCAGEYVVRLTVRGREGETRIILQPVLAQADEIALVADAGEGGIRFYLDSPVAKDGKAIEPIRGFLSLSGWAFSGAGVCGIEVFVDDRSQGQAFRGIRREDLHATFGRKEALRSGFAMLVPPQVMKRGRHDVRVVIRDNAGHVEEVAFSVDAEPSMDGPGPWSLRHKLPQSEISLQLDILKAAGHQPEWTLLLPLGRVSAATVKRARATLESLRHQAYPDWQLVLPVASEAEGEAVLAGLLPDFDELVDRVRVVVATPDTRMAEFPLRRGRPALLCLLAPGDQLGEDALLELSVEGALRDRPDFLYSDERRLDPSDGTVRAFFKPDWSPDLLLSTNYIGRLWAATVDLLNRVGVQLGDLERHGEYDLALRLTERAERISHVAKVLCARGARSLDTPASERRALQRALLRRGVQGDILAGCLPGTFRVRRAPITAGLVSIIIPTIATRGLVKTAIDSIRERTRYHDFEIICLDNIPADDDPEHCHWKQWLREHSDCVIEIAETFNWSRFNNIGVRSARGEFLLFLNDDVEVVDGGWLDGLLEHAQRPEIGAVGPQLLYPDGKVQHAGMFLSGRVGRHAFRFSPCDEPGPFGLALTQRNVISVTGACLMTRRTVFDGLGGFDEEHSVINNDLDFCLRARRAGHDVVYTPHVTLTHHEMVSRGELRDSYNAAHFDAVWQDLFLSGDPFFNPNLATDVDDYVPEEEPVRLLHVGHPVVMREAVRRILVVKVDHIGDFISAFPALRRVKQRFPNAELTVLAAQASLSLAALEPAIDHVIRFDFFHARSERGRRSVNKKELQRLREELAPRRFDMAIDLRRQPDTRPILQYTGARWLAGFDQRNQMSWLDIAVEWEGDIARTQKRTHVSDALVQFVDAVAVACESDRRVILSPPGAREARRALAELPEIEALGPDLFARPLVCVHTGAGSENKRWPTAAFAGLIDLLVAQDRVNVVIIGGPDEAGLLNALLAEIHEPSHVFSLVGRIGLRNLPLVLLACDLYVGNDSGPKHIAASLSVPTIGIHAGSVDATEWGPMGPAAFGIRREMTCSPCYLAKVSDCHRGLACLNGIRVGDVHRACRRLLALARNPADYVIDRPAGAEALDRNMLAAG